MTFRLAATLARSVELSSINFRQMIDRGPNPEQRNTEDKPLGCTSGSSYRRQPVTHADMEWDVPQQLF